MPGAHSKQSIHNAVFLDGHAAPAYVTTRDVEKWGARIPGRYVPKSGDGWREVNSYDSKDIYAPWGGTDPFGGTNNRQGVATGG